VVSLEDARSLEDIFLVVNISPDSSVARQSFLIVDVFGGAKSLYAGLILESSSSKEGSSLISGVISEFLLFLNLKDSRSP